MVIIWIIILIIGITLIKILNKRYFLLAGCKRVRTIDGSKLENNIALPDGDTIFGNNFDFIFLTSEKIFEKLTKYAIQLKRNYVLHFLRIPILLIVEPEYAELILKNSNLLSKGLFYRFLEPFLGQGLLTSTNAEWYFQRKLLTPTFHFNILLSYFENFKVLAEELVNVLPNHMESEVLNLSKFIPIYSLKNICHTALSIDAGNEGNSYIKNIYKADKLFFKRVSNLFKCIDIVYNFTADKKIYDKHMNKIKSFTNNLIEKRKVIFNSNIEETKLLSNDRYFTKERFCMLDTLLMANLKRNINSKDIHDQVETFMFEGFDTTTSGLTFALLNLAWHQNVQKECYEEIIQNLPDEITDISYSDCNKLKYLECVIKESLRLFPPVPFISRKCENEEILGNLILPTGTELIISIFSIHRNSKYFERPNEFDPSRFSSENRANRHPFSYIPFSAGPRNCIGQKFVQLEMKICLARILKKYQLFPFTKLTDIKFQCGITLRAQDDLKIIIKNR